jgi:squalene synthase HpnC
MPARTRQATKNDGLSYKGSVLLPAEYVRDSTAMNREWSGGESLAYTHWLATHHYENFHVVSFLLPKKLHQDFYNVYSFCRWADDLGDEIGDKAESLRLLEWWRVELDAMYAGKTRHPVFTALRGTMERYRIPKEPFADLIRAFVQDQTVPRYETWEGVLNYCVYSANPVGRLVLYLCGYSDAERQQLSDCTCTALQLANFWQDVTVDLLKDRVYIPLEVVARNHYTVEDLFARRMNENFRNVMIEVVDRARELFLEGLPLARRVDRRLGIDLDLFSRGGMHVLKKIEQQNYDVLGRRPAISKLERAGLLLASVARMTIGRAA